MAGATFLDCSPEIHQMIYTLLKTDSDRFALISTCSVLYSAFRIKFLCDVLDEFIWKQTIVGFGVQVHEEIQSRMPVTGNDLDLCTGDEYSFEDEEEVAEREIIEFELTPEIMEGMEVMTGSLLRKYWGHSCPECMGGRSICPGCGASMTAGGNMSPPGVGCAASHRYMMPCPSCFGLQLAEEYGTLTNSDDEQAMAEVWRKLDDMDGM
ncbi:hypothetical protein B0H17DRAFT_1124283 [Mycena rosella]|uniref:F-box domain-containing protein n=1 Tax=Mycena rosella TaxID=1033263 RepID=A0AAD7H1L2_MYCRO|nr:hypothetical protein B0H17DRAFT_1124283 [Mycena rosella]